MLTESLESRTLMSASAVSTQVAADHLQIKADLLQFKGDSLSNTAIILTDIQSLKKDGLKNDPTLKPLFKQLNIDLQQMRTQLRIDRLTQAGNVLKDQATIVLEQRKILLDKHHDKDNVDDDRADLLDDRIHLQDDEIAGLTTRLTTRQNAYTKIFADLDLITAALTNDTNTTPALTADVQKFAADRTNTLQTMTTDLQKLITDRTQLTNDLTAMQNT